MERAPCIHNQSLKHRRDTDFMTAAYVRILTD